MDSSYIPPHLDVSIISTRTCTNTRAHICVTVKPWATGTPLLKPLVTLGNRAYTHIARARNLANCVAQSKLLRPLGDLLPVNNAPAQSSKSKAVSERTAEPL